MVKAVYKDAGEPTDLYIYDGVGAFDLTTAGSQDILQLLNRAYRRMTNWKMPGGAVIRFSACNRRKLFSVASVAITVSGVSGTTVVLSAPAMTVDAKYVEWTLEVGSERRVVMSYDGVSRTAIVHAAFAATIPDGTVATLYKRWFRFEVEDGVSWHPGEVVPVSASGEIQAVQSVFDLTNQAQLTKPKRTDETWQNMIEAMGTAGQFNQIALGIEFDVAPASGTAFLMRYYGLPEALTAATQSPRIPDAWHDTIVMMASWYRKKTDGETDEAYALRKDVEAAVAQNVQEVEMSFEFDDATLYIGEE